MRLRGVIAIILTSLLFGVGLMFAPAASADVLIEATPSSVCLGNTFEVGVWYQKFSGGPRGYRISVFGPAGVRVFYRHGLATTTWQTWRVRAAHLGKYRTLYQSGPDANPQWHWNYYTTARRC